MVQHISDPPATYVPSDAPSSKMYLQATQYDVPNFTNTLVELDRVPAEYTDGIEDAVNHKITPGVEGFYCVVGQITYFNVVPDKQYQVRVAISAVPVFAGIGVSHASVNEQISCIVVLPCLYLDVADFVALYAFHEAGVGTVDIESNGNYTYLSCQRVR